MDAAGSSSNPFGQKEKREDTRQELKKLESMLEQLKVEYEQHFLGILQHPPTRLHNQVTRKIRDLRNAPFKNSQMKYTLRSLDRRYQTYNNYWTRVQRQREEGTYVRDVFKANLRERLAREEAEAQTTKGKAKNNVRTLFDAYKHELEKHTGKQQNLDFGKFQKSLVKRAKDFKARNGDKKLSFKVVVKDGRVTVQAKAKQS